jgi:6-phosphogluconolactonase (cycloisomerase 2 family)
MTSLSVAVTPKQMLGQQSPLIANALYTDGTSEDVTTSVSWTSSNPLVLSVSATGSTSHTPAPSGFAKFAKASEDATPQAVSNQLGVAYISASVSGKNATAKVTVLGYPRFAYVANILNDSVSSYSIDSDTGDLRPNGYAFTVTTAFTSCFKVHPSGNFGYAVNFWPQGGQNGAQPSISTFSVKDDGTLVKSGPEMTVPVRPGCLQISPNGNFAYLMSLEEHTISGYSINSDTAKLTELAGSPWGVPSEPWGMDIDPTGRFLYLTTVDKIFGFTLDGETGSLTAIPESPFAGWPDGNLIAIEPAGRFAYVTDPSTDGITVYQIDSGTGALTEVAGARTSAGGLNPQRPVFDRTGQYLYVPNMLSTWGQTTGNIGGFRMNAETGLLSVLPGAPFPAGEIPKDAAVDVDGLGKFLYVTDGSNFVRSYGIDQSTGRLTYLDKFATRRGVFSVTVLSGTTPVSRQSKHAWVLNKDDGSILTFALDPATGLALQSTAATAPGSTQLAMEPGAGWAYVTNPITDRVYTFQADTLGALTSYSNFDFNGRAPVASVVDHSGFAAYTANSTANNVTVFGHIMDLVTPAFNVAAGPAPTLLGVDPNDQYLYVFNSGDGTVSWYELLPGYGYPTEVKWGNIPSPQPFALDVKAMAFEPRGKYVYTISGNSLLGFSIDYFNIGTLVPITSFSDISLNSPVALISDAHGRQLYVADADGIHAFSINAATGLLSPSGQNVPAGSSPTSIAIDGSGLWLFVTDRSLGLQQFEISPEDGKLTSYSVIPTGQSPASVVVDDFVQ